MAQRSWSKKSYTVSYANEFLEEHSTCSEADNSSCQVLRMVVGEKKPAMGYIYAAMDRAKETIARDFNWNKEKYEKTFEIIDKRWECQLQHPFHAAGYFLNLLIHYKYHDDVRCAEVEGCLYDCITRLVF